MNENWKCIAFLPLGQKSGVTILPVKKDEKWYLVDQNTGRNFAGPFSNEGMARKQLQEYFNISSSL